MCLIQKIINSVVKRGNWVLIRGALIREGRLVQNGSKGGRLIEDLRYTVYTCCVNSVYVYREVRILCIKYTL